MEVLTQDSTIQLAGLQDFEQFKHLLDVANQHSLERSGLLAWHDLDKAYDQIKRLLEQGRSYIMRDTDGYITSTISISDQGANWGQAHSQAALYLHKLMKDPTRAKPGEAVKLIGFAAQQAANQNKTLLRCDTGSALTRLVNYYVGLGFKPRGVFKYHPSGKPGVLLEAKVADLLERH